MPRTKGALFSSEEKKEVIRDLYEESIAGQMEKELKKYYAMELIYDDCRYCGEISEFYLHGEGTSEYKKNGRKYIVSHCQHCNARNYIMFKVKQEGDILHGFVYEPDVILRREEDVIKPEMPGQEMGSTVPEKKPQPNNIIRVRLDH